MKTPDAITALAALAQSTRLDVYRLLVQQGPKGFSASTIAEKLALPNATLSFHLKELSHAGLIVARQEGRFIFYSANFTVMTALVGYLTENCCGGNGCATNDQLQKTKARRAA